MKKLFSLLVVMTLSLTAMCQYYTIQPSPSNYCQGSQLTVKYYYAGTAVPNPNASSYHLELWANTALPVYTGFQIGSDFWTDSSGYMKKYSASSPGTYTLTVPAIGSQVGTQYNILIYLANGSNAPSSNSQPTTGRQITVYSPLSAPTISGPSTSCSGSQTTFTCSAMPSYTWSHGGQTTQIITVSPTATTTYTVSSSNMCSSVFGTHVLTVSATSATPTLTTTDSVLCWNTGKTATLNSTYSGTNRWYRNGNLLGNTLQSFTTNTGIAIGTYVFYVMADTNGCLSDTSNKITIKVDNCTGLKNTESTWDYIVMHPNPATQFLNVTLGNDAQGELIQIFNMGGQKVAEHPIDSRNETLDVSSLPVGMYFVIVLFNENSDYRRVGKFVKE